MTSGIYYIKNVINKKLYIGRSNDIEYRWKKHISSLNKGTHYNRYLQRSWDQYGSDNFTFSIIEECSYEQTGDKEHYWILHYQSHLNQYGYNMSLGGEGEIPTEETRKKRSLSMLGKNVGRKHTAEELRKISAASTGRKHTPETIRKLKELNTGSNHPNFGKTFSEEHRHKMSLSRTSEKNGFYNKVHTETTKHAISIANKGKTAWNKGSLKLSLESIDEIYQRLQNGEARKKLQLEFNVGKGTIERIAKAEGPYSFLKEKEVR